MRGIVILNPFPGFCMEKALYDELMLKRRLITGGASGEGNLEQLARFDHQHGLFHVSEKNLGSARDDYRADLRAVIEDAA